MLVAGAAWIVFISLVSALVQSLAPDWVRARVLAVFMLVFQGGLAAGSASGAPWPRAPACRRAAVGRPWNRRDDGARTRGEVAGRDHGREPVESLADAGHRRRRSARVSTRARCSSRSSTGSIAIGRTSSSRRFTSTAACAVGTARLGGASIGISRDADRYRRDVPRRFLGGASSSARAVDERGP